MTQEISNIGWVICRTVASNWDESKMDFADYSEVTYDLYATDQVDEDGLKFDAEPMNTISHDEFTSLGLRDRVNWGDVSPSYEETLHGPADTCEITQGGSVR